MSTYDIYKRPLKQQQVVMRCIVIWHTVESINLWVGLIA